MVARLDFAVESAADFARLRGRFAELPMQPKILQTREGGVDISSPGRQSLSLLVGEETAGALYATDVYLGPGFGAPPHHQPTEEEFWYLVEGELDVRVGAQSARLRAGSFAFVPRNTMHTFRNNGASPVRLLAWNSPAGHERAFEAMRKKADEGITAFSELREMFRTYEIVMHADDGETAQHAPPTGVPPKLVLDRAHGRDASWPGVDVRLLLSGEESGGRFAVADVYLEARCAMPAHRDELTETCLYFLEGAADLTLGTRPQRVGPGAFAFIPRHSRLQIANAGERRAHFVLWTIPAVGSWPSPA